jgi:hypothetical protein
VGCQPDFDPAAYLNGLRVLAVDAEPPEAAPGESGQLTALVFDSGSRPITLEWALCKLAPATTDVVNPDCITMDTPDVVDMLGGANPLVITMPDKGVTLSDLEHGATPLGYPDTTAGLYVPIRLRARAGSDVVTAVYRWRYHVPGSPVPPNRNPRLTALHLVNPSDGGAPVATDAFAPDAMSDGAPATPFDGGGAIPGIAECQPDAAMAMAGSDGGVNQVIVATGELIPIQSNQTITLAPAFAEGSAEEYPAVQVDPNDVTHPHLCLARELLRVSWFATAGSFNAGTTGDGDANTFTADKHLPPSGSIIDLFIVGRDDRGGMDSLHRQLLLQ